MMVSPFLKLVDTPLPQTQFVLIKAWHVILNTVLLE